MNQSSAPAQISATPKQLTETLVPFLDTDSNGELPPDTDQYLNDKPTLPERLLQVVPRLGEENQAIVLPPPLKSKMKTGDEPEDHQSLEVLTPPLDTQSLNQRKFFLSSPNLDKDLVQHRRLAKVVIGTPIQFANKELLEQLQDDYSDSGTDIIYPEENRPMDFPGGPDQPPKLPEELEISSLLQETPAVPLQSTLEEPEPFLPGVEAQAKHPESPEETETPPLLQEALSQPPEILKEAGHSVGPQEAPVEPSSTPEVQQEASAQPTEAPEEVEPSTPQEAPAQPPEEEVPPQEVNVPSLSQNEAQRPKLHNVAVKPVDLALTGTVTQPPQHPEKAEPSPVPQEVPAQPVELPEGTGPTLVTQEAPEQAVELPEEAGPTLLTQEAPAEPAQLPNEGESSTEQETPGQSPGDIEASAILQEQPPQLPEQSLGEVEPIPTQQEHPAQPLEHHEVTVAPPGHHQVQHLNLPNIIVKAADVQVTVTPEPTTEVGPLPVQHESVAQPSVPINVEPFATQHEAPTLPPQSPEDIELLPFQQETPTESPESPTQEKPPTQQETPVQTPGEVKPSRNQQDTLAPDSQAPEEGESPSIQEEALAQLPRTQEEKEPSPPQQEAPAELPQIPEEGEPSSIQEESQGHHAQTPEKAKPSSTQQEAPTQYLQTSEEGEPSPAQEEAPTQFPQMSEKSESLTQEESQGQHPQTSEEVAPSPIQQEAPAQHPQASEGIKPPLTQGESPTQHPQTPEVGEPSPTQTEAPANYPESLEGIEPVPAQSEATVQHPNPLGEVKPSATHQEAPSQHLQTYEEVKSSATQQEATAQHPEPSGEVEPSPTQQEVPAHSPEHHVVTVSPLGQSQAELLLFPKVPVKPVDLALIITPESTNEVETSLPQQEASAQSAISPEQLEPSAIQQEFPEQHPAPAENVEPSPVQQGVPTQTGDLPEETELSPSQQWSSSLPQMPVVGVEPSPVQPEHQAQPPESSTDIVTQPPVHHEVTISSLGPGEAQHPMLPNITVKRVDLEVFITPVPTKFEHSPGHQEAPAQAPVPPEQVGFSPAHSKLHFQSPETPEDEFLPRQQELVVQTQDPPKEMEPTSAQQEVPDETSEPPKEIEPSANEYAVSAHSPGPTEDVKPPTQPEVPAQSPVPQQVPAISPEPPQEAEPSPTQQESPAQSLELADKVEPLPVSQETPSQLLQFPERVESSPVLQEAPSLPLEPLKEVELSPAQEVAQTQPSELPEKLESFPILQQASTQSPEPHQESEPSPAQPPEPSKEVEPQLPVHKEMTVPPQGQDQAQHSGLPTVTAKPVDLELTVPPEPSTTLQQTLAPPEDPEVTLLHPEHVEAQSPNLSEVTVQPLDLELTITPEPITEVETSTMQETPGPPLEPPEEFVVQPPMYREVTVPTPGQDQARHLLLPNVTVQPLDLELTITPEPTMKVEHSTTVKKTTAPPKDLEVTFAHQEQVQAQHPILTEVTVQPLYLGLTITPEFTKEIELPQSKQETPIQLPGPPKEVTVAQSPVYQEETIPTPGRNQTQDPSSPNVRVQPLDLGLTVSPEPTTEVEHSTALKKTTAPPKDLEVTFAHLEQVLSYRPNLTNVTGQPLDLELTITPESTTEIEPSPAMRLELPKELVAQPSIYQEAAVPTSAQDQAQHLWSPNVTTQPLTLELTITPKPTTEVEQSTTLHQTTAPPKDLEVTFPPPEQVQVQHSTLNKVTVKPLDLGLTITPEPTTETKPSPTMQETTTQPPEPPKEAVVQYPFHQKRTAPTLGQDQAPYPTLRSVTVHTVDMGRTITPEPTTQVERSTTTKTTTPPPKDLEMTLAHLEQIQNQHPNLTEVTVPPMDLEITVTAGSNMEVEPSPAIQETPAQPPEPPKEVVVQYPFHQEVMIPTPSKGEGQHPESPSITFHHVGLGLTITPEPITEAKHAATTKKTTAPFPAGPEVTHAHRERVQSQQPNLTEVTVPPMDLEITVSHQPESSESVLPPTTQHSGVHFAEYFPEKAYTTLTEQPEQNVTTNVNICELCTCKDETLSCSGFSPKQRLRRVPVPEPNMDNNTFTILNFQGNSISYIEENTWKPYRWTEKLILSENYLTELHKDSFEGLLSLQYLDLSCNKIQSIERRTFEALPFLQFINLRCNLLTELSFGTFQAWHGMQFLHKLHKIREEIDYGKPAVVDNPKCSCDVDIVIPTLGTRKSKLRDIGLIERKHSPSVWTRIGEFGEKNKNRDMGTTQVSLSTIDSILMKTLELEKLILPNLMSCCPCRFKNNIEVVCKIVKLHCDGECLTNATHCDEEVCIRNAEGSFMKVFKARKKSTSTELTIEPEKASSDKNAIGLSAFMNGQLNFNDETDVISALNYILPYFSDGNIEDVESTLLPFIIILFSKVQDGDKSVGYLTNNTKSPSLEPGPNNSTYKNKLRKVSFLENLLDAEIQEKNDEVKKKEKTAMLIPLRLLGPKFKCQIFPKKLETAQGQEKSLPKAKNVRKRRFRINRVLKAPKDLQKRHYKEVDVQSTRGKQSAQSFVKNMAKERRLSRPSPRELEELRMAQRPRKLVGNSVHTEPSFIKEHKAAASSFPKQHIMGSPSASTAPKSLPKVRHNSKDLTYPIVVLEDANARVREMEASRPVSHSGKKYIFHKIRSRIVRRTPKTKQNQKFRKKNSLSNILMPAQRPPLPAVRSLTDSPSREAISSSGEWTQENPFPELLTLSEPSKENSTVENTTAQNVSEEIISPGSTTVSEQTPPEFAKCRNLPTTYSSTTRDNFVPTVKQTNETQWEYHNLVTDLPPKPTGFSVAKLSSAGDLFEIQLNQQLRSLIPNNDVRRLISHVIRTLTMDCSETNVQLACAKLISRTGLLMKLLSEQQEVKVSKAEWDTDQWKTENYINESTEAQNEQKGQESRELSKEVPGYGYNNKLILAISVTVVVMILIIVFCLVEIYSHRAAPVEDEEGGSRLFFNSLLHKRCSIERESQEGFFWRRWPLWLRDMYRPLNATRKKNMAQKLHDRDSSDEDEIFNKEPGEKSDAPAEKPQAADSAVGDLGKYIGGATYPFSWTTPLASPDSTEGPMYG
ncbi:Leucine-rich repeat-containing protein 37A2 [Vulpes lagopus]